MTAVPGEGLQREFSLQITQLHGPLTPVQRELCGSLEQGTLKTIQGEPSLGQRPSSPQAPVLQQQIAPLLQLSVRSGAMKGPVSRSCPVKGAASPRIRFRAGWLCHNGAERLSSRLRRSLLRPSLPASCTRRPGASSRASVT